MNRAWKPHSAGVDHWPIPLSLRDAMPPSTRNLNRRKVLYYLVGFVHHAAICRSILLKVLGCILQNTKGPLSLTNFDGKAEHVSGRLYPSRCPLQNRSVFTIPSSVFIHSPGDSTTYIPCIYVLPFQQILEKFVDAQGIPLHAVCTILISFPDLVSRSFRIDTDTAIRPLTCHVALTNLEYLYLKANHALNRGYFLNRFTVPSLVILILLCPRILYSYGHR
jgi:hypothetical protein